MTDEETLEEILHDVEIVDMKKALTTLLAQVRAEERERIKAELVKTSDGWRRIAKEDYRSEGEGYHRCLGYASMIEAATEAALRSPGGVK